MCCLSCVFVSHRVAKITHVQRSILGHLLAITSTAKWHLRNMEVLRHLYTQASPHNFLCLNIICGRSDSQACSLISIVSAVVGMSIAVSSPLMHLAYLLKDLIISTTILRDQILKFEWTKKGLRDPNSPTYTLSQTGFGEMCMLKLH